MRFTYKRMGDRWVAALIEPAPLLPLVLVTGALLAVSAWLLAAPARLVSREMTWDLLFNLSGAWHLANGHTSHVDFHDPLGRLGLALTVIGFKLGGTNIFAFVTGQLIVAAAAFVAAVAAAARRLALVPAAVFVLFVVELVLMPINVGDLVTSYSFAMAYNRYCWAAFCVLSLILFVPPRRTGAVGGRTTRGDWIDVAVGACLIGALYYLKLTYFAAALVALVVAFGVSEHVQSRCRAWVGVGIAVAVNALAPFNWAYLTDFRAALSSGAVRESPVNLAITLFANVPELSLYTTALLVTVALWRSGRAPLRLPVAVALLIGMGVAVLSQNAQTRGVPLGIVVAFLLYDHIRSQAATSLATSEGRRAVTWLLLAFLVFPVAYLGRSAASIASYHYKASHGSGLFVVDRTNLKGLAVPAEPAGLLDAFARGPVDYTLFNRSRAVGPRYEMSQFEYVETILEAAALFDEPGERPGGIVLLDQVNPLPFMLGRVPPRGSNLWLDSEFPAQPAARMFAEADYVLIPKFASNSIVVANAIELYGPWLAQHYPGRFESRSWIVLDRKKP